MRVPAGGFRDGREELNADFRFSFRWRGNIRKEKKKVINYPRFSSVYVKIVPLVRSTQFSNCRSGGTPRPLEVH